MKFPRCKAVLFDLDGTLLDTAGDLVAALNHVRELEDLSPLPVSEYQRYVSQGAVGLLRAGMPAGDPSRSEQRKSRFLEHYASHSLEYTRPYDGVESVLEHLEARGIAWGVVTNKSTLLTLPIIEAIGWSTRAACVVCGDTAARPKPHPDPVLLACELVRVRPDQALMVGDDPRDLDAGLAAGTGAVLAAYGYGAKEVLDSGRSLEHVLWQPLDLLAMLEPVVASGG